MTVGRLVAAWRQKIGERDGPITQERMAEMIGMTVTDDDDLYRRRIEAELLKSGQKLRVYLVGRKSVDHQQAGGRFDHGRNRPLIADHVHIVENLGGLDGRIGRTVRARGFAKEVGFLRPSASRGLFRFLDKHLDRVGIRLRGCGWRRRRLSVAMWPPERRQSNRQRRLHE